MEDSVHVRRQRLEAMRQRKAGDKLEATSNALEHHPRGPAMPRGAAINLVLQRLRGILSQPAPSSPQVAGTPVREQNLVQLITLLRERAANPEVKGAKLAARILHFLEQDDGGPKTVENVSVGQLKKFISLAARVGGGRGSGQAREAMPSIQVGARAMGALRSLRDEMRTLNQRIDRLETPPSEESAGNKTTLGQ